MYFGVRWFCGLPFNDTVPDPSTWAMLHNHRWACAAVWERALDATAVRAGGVI
jgi:hypothetical protein